jgi:hypothetical protein
VSGKIDTPHTSQFPIKNWYEVFSQNPTPGGAFLDRETGNKRKELTGESKRRKQKKKNKVKPRRQN